MSGATVIGFKGEEEIKVGANQRRLNCQLPKKKERTRGCGGGKGRHGVRLGQWRTLCRGHNEVKLQERTRQSMSPYLSVHTGAWSPLGVKPQPGHPTLAFVAVFQSLSIQVD